MKVSLVYVAFTSCQLNLQAFPSETYYYSLLPVTAFQSIDLRWKLKIPMFQKFARIRNSTQIFSTQKLSIPVPGMLKNTNSNIDYTTEQLLALVSNDCAPTIISNDINLQSRVENFYCNMVQNGEERRSEQINVSCFFIASCFRFDHLLACAFCFSTAFYCINVSGSGQPPSVLVSFRPAHFPSRGRNNVIFRLIDTKLCVCVFFYFGCALASRCYVLSFILQMCVVNAWRLLHNYIVL